MADRRCWTRSMNPTRSSVLQHSIQKSGRAPNDTFENVLYDTKWGLNKTRRHNTYHLCFGLECDDRTMWSGLWNGHPSPWFFFFRSPRNVTKDTKERKRLTNLSVSEHGATKRKIKRKAPHSFSHVVRLSSFHSSSLSAHFHSSQKKISTELGTFNWIIYKVKRRCLHIRRIFCHGWWETTTAVL